MKQRIFLLTASCALLAAALTGCDSSSTGSFSSPGSPTPASSSGSYQVALSWTPSNTGSPLGYTVEQSTDGISYSQVQTVLAPTTSATITGLTSGTSYYFRVSAYNTACGSSAYTSATQVNIP